MVKCSSQMAVLICVHLSCPKWGFFGTDTNRFLARIEIHQFSHLNVATLQILSDITTFIKWNYCHCWKYACIESKITIWKMLKKREGERDLTSYFEQRTEHALDKPLFRRFSVLVRNIHLASENYHRGHCLQRFYCLSVTLMLLTDVEDEICWWQ